MHLCICRYVLAGANLCIQVTHRCYVVMRCERSTVVYSHVCVRLHKWLWGGTQVDVDVHVEVVVDVVVVAVVD